MFLCILGPGCTVTAITCVVLFSCITPSPFLLLYLFRYFRRLRQAQVLEYHLFRSVFLRLNRSLLTPAFDYARYSANIVDEIIIVFFDVEWASWLFAVIILFVTLPISTDGVSNMSYRRRHLRSVTCPTVDAIKISSPNLGCFPRRPPPPIL